MAILFNLRIALEVLDSEQDKHGHYSTLINEETITFCSLYGPNSDLPSFFKTLFATLLDFAHDKVILGGDFNIVLDMIWISMAQFRMAIKQREKLCPVI